jgi:WD40 repeat protein
MQSFNLKMNFQFKLIFLIFSTILNKAYHAQNLTLKKHTNFIRGISFTNDNKVITTSADNTIKVWDSLKNWTLTLDYFEYIPFSCCQYSFINENGLYTATSGSIAYIWNLTDSNKLIRTYNEHTGLIFSLAMTAKNILATGSADKKIKIWSLYLNNSLFTLNGHTAGIYSLAFTGDSTLISGSDDFSIKIWNITNGQCLKTLTGHTNYVRSLLIISNELFVSGSADLTVKIWNVNSSCLGTLTGHTSEIRSMTKITDSIIVSAGDDLNIMVWNLTDYKNITLLKPYPRLRYRSIIYSSNLDILVAGQDSGYLLVWFKFIEMFSLNHNSMIAKIADMDSTATRLLDHSTSFEKTDENEIISTKTTIADMDWTVTRILDHSTSFEKTDENEIIQNLFINKNSSISFDSILSPNASTNELKLIISLLSQSKYDLNDCLTNCSNHGKCKLSLKNKIICECDPYFDGSKCDVDLRPCSYSPCLNSIKCENKFPTINQTEFDFNCECKSKLFYGKRCENKINLCKNETCSKNGICKIINENELNEKTKCECFGNGFFEGEKCEINTLKQTIIRTTTKLTTYIAISIVILFFLFIFLMDLHKFCSNKRSYAGSRKSKPKKINIQKPKPMKLVYVP